MISMFLGGIIMPIADFAASALRTVSKHNAKKLKRKRTTPPITDHIIKNVKGDKYKVGFASRDVMPDDFGTTVHWVAGHGPGHKAEGIHDPITVSAVWIGCGDNGGFIMVSADCIGITNSEVDKIRDSLSDFSKKSNCKSINICCTHNHAGFDTVGYWGKLPKTGKNNAYMDKLLFAISEICKAAYYNRKDGDIYIGSAHVPEAQMKKRPPEVLHDVLTRIRFVPDDGGAETWFLNYAAHPNTLGGANRQISADYPYYLRKTIKREKDVNILFGVGAIGAVDPGNFCEDKTERTKLQGECLGKAALSISDDEKLECEFTVLRQPFYIPVDNSVLAFLASLKIMSSKRYPFDKGELGLALKTEMTYIELGKQKILLLPGENFPETVYGGYLSAQDSSTGDSPDINPEPLVSIAKDDNLLVFGVSNDMTGYVVPPNDFILNRTQPYLSNGNDRFGISHYHETNSLGILAQQTIADVFRHITERMNCSCT